MIFIDLLQEKEEILKRLEMNETYIKALQDKIKALTGEKDALMGRVRMLEEEKQLYQVIRLLTINL